ncbi:MAG: geranylgeranyl reductase family protein [Chloroflexi bacterium]|nr:geranylgeranyl reductase family protein [Chloroflexota bacterium]MBU1751505.1 geranylgeranyl reductase family protein [Chloroflexota bacterium]
MTDNNHSADILIVGAGPAGAAAAYFAARAGARVLLADRARFPRDKVCGDGVSSVALPVLDRMGLGNWVPAGRFVEPRVILICAPNGQFATTRPAMQDGSSCGYTIPRRVLDEAVFQQAVSAGVRPLEGTRVIGRTGQEDGYHRLAAKQNGRDLALAARLIIAADGAAGGFTRSLGLLRRKPEMVACRAYYEDVAGDPDRLDIYYDRTVMPGYVWVFPESDGRANVGLGTYIQRVKQDSIDLAAALERFIAGNPLIRERLGAARRVTPIQGYPLRARIDSTMPVSDGVLVAGEAAGLVSPLTGEGIGPALESGELAARHALLALEIGDVSALALAPYARELERRWAGEHRTARVIRAFLRHQVVVNRVVRQMQRNPAFALQVGYAIIGARPVNTVLTPRGVARFLFPP